MGKPTKIIKITLSNDPIYIFYFIASDISTKLRVNWPTTLVQLSPILGHLNEASNGFSTDFPRRSENYSKWV